MSQGMLRRTLILVTVFTIGVAGVARATPKDEWPRLNSELWINSDDLDASHAGTHSNSVIPDGPETSTLFFK